MVARLLNKHFFNPALVLMLIGLGLYGQRASAQGETYITVEDGQFIRHGAPYYFLGANLWYGMNLGSEGEGGDRARLIRELDRLQELGITNLRVMGATEGPADAPWRVQPALQNAPGEFDEELLVGLDFLLAEMGKRDMNAVICMNNFFQWSGGMAQYVAWSQGVEIPYPHDPEHTWDEFQRFSAEFFADRKAQRMFRQALKTVIQRRNSITGQLYEDDPAIMAWQLANEPRGFERAEAYASWVGRTARYIHRLDKNHLVSLGGEGFLLPEVGTRFAEVSQNRHLDYLTCHLWVENWGWYHPAQPEATYDSAWIKAVDYLGRHVELAARVNKPLVLEEFGVSRDGGIFADSADTEWRDRFYESLFTEILDHARTRKVMAGCNFWSWSGEGIPLRPGESWEEGDPFTGDPPHEIQGWYGVYIHDLKTRELIRRNAREMNQLGEQ